jgi:plastocyanin
MSTRQTRILLSLTAAVLLSIATIVAIVPRLSVTERRSNVREIRLTVRDMTYYADGRSDPNPALTVRRGEQVRVVLRNEDPGMTHDFAVPAWNVRTPRLDAGAEAVLHFQVPEQAGANTYSCTPHGEMMKGTITVE